MKKDDQLYLLNLEIMDQLEYILDELHSWLIEIQTNHEVPTQPELTAVERLTED